jgi:chromatin remodeling complex protein RSC6
MAKKKVKKKAAKKTAKKKVAKKAPKKKAARPKAKKVKKVKTKRKPNPAFMRPLMPSAILAAVVGANPIPRPEVVKKLWAYIRKNGLQDAVNRRMINADDKMRAVFGGRGQVDMFEMNRLVNKQLS